MRYPSRSRCAVAGLIAAALVVWMAGCTSRRAEQRVKASAPVRILAYINVSSGCQELTIGLLRSLGTQYPGRVTVEIVDFGDQGDGDKRWKASGHDCMTIEIDGSPLVEFETGGQTKTVALRQPVGFWWTHDDLRAAVAAAVDGKLQRGTEEEALAGQPTRKVEAHVATEEVKREGKTYARLLINERPAMLIRTASGGRSPGERAETAAAVLKAWLKGPVKPNEIDRQPVSGGWAVRVKGQVVAVATSADGKAAGGTADQVAKKWLVGIRQGLAIAARPAGAPDVAQKAEADEGCETGG